MTACAPTLTPCEDAQRRLAAARKARESVLLGGGVQQNAYGDTQVTYFKPDLPSLVVLISELEDEVARECGTCRRTRRGAIQFIPC